MKPTGYRTKEHGVAVKRYVQLLDLKEDEALIAAYRRHHSRGGVWQEILDGIRAVGILEMEIYLLGNRAVMIVETHLTFDWEAAMARLATLPRQAEWEACVAAFQQCRADAASDEKWQMAERIFHLYE